MNSEAKDTGFNASWMNHFCFNLMVCRIRKRFWKVICDWKGKCRCAWQGSSHLVSRHGELLELHVKLWVASRGSSKLVLNSELPAAKKTQTCDSNYDLHKDLSLCKSQKEREGEVRLKCHLSPFNWCLTMTSFAQAGPSPMGEEVWFTDCCSWLWQLAVLLPLPHSRVLCGQKTTSLCRKNPKDQQHDMWVMFCFFCQPSTEWMLSGCINISSGGFHAVSSQ